MRLHPSWCWHAGTALLPVLATILGIGMMLAAALPARAQKGSTAPAQHNLPCGAVAQSTWLDVFLVSASANGPCAQADIVLTLANPAGTIVWQETYRSDQLFGLSSASNPTELETELMLWVTQYVDGRPSGTLPDWLAGQGEPVALEFPFYVDEGVSRDAYVELRTADRPMVCYVQGMESARCLVVTPDGKGVESPGVQSFPG